MRPPKSARLRLRSLARRALLSGIPGRYRLASEFLIERLMGRLEEELLMLGGLTSLKGTAVDVGANRGYYSLAMSRLFSKVVVFEPNGRLTANLARCGAKNITIHHCALSSSEGMLTLHLPLRNGRVYDGWASVDGEQLSGWDAYDVITVPGRRLDDFGLQDISLIKIDVEGHEVAMLEGSTRTIRNNRPVVIIEIKKPNRDAVGRFFEQLSYVPHVASKGRLQPLTDGIDRYEGTKEMFIFVPAGSQARSHR